MIYPTRPFLLIKSQTYFHTLIIRTGPFPFKGLLDGSFHFYLNLNLVYSILEANCGDHYQSPGQRDHCNLLKIMKLFYFIQFENAIFRIIKNQHLT